MAFKASTQLDRQWIEPRSEPILALPCRETTSFALELKRLFVPGDQRLRGLNILGELLGLVT